MSDEQPVTENLSPEQKADVPVREIPGDNVQESVSSVPLSAGSPSAAPPSAASLSDVSASAEPAPSESSAVSPDPSTPVSPSPESAPVSALQPDQPSEAPAAPAEPAPSKPSEPSEAPAAPAEPESSKPSEPSEAPAAPAQPESSKPSEPSEAPAAPAEPESSKLSEPSDKLANPVQPEPSKPSEPAAEQANAVQPELSKPSEPAAEQANAAEPELSKPSEPSEEQVTPAHPEPSEPSEPSEKAEQTQDSEPELSESAVPAEENKKEGNKADGEQPVTGEEQTDGNQPQKKPSGLFAKYITQNKIFRNREVLRHSYNPRELPHRDEQIDSIAEILAPALQGATPSNILIYGKTGTGKTATVKYVGGELENESSEFTRCRLVHLNCETIDTQYRVLAQIANYISGVETKPSDRMKNTIPPTGWHTDQVYSELKNILEQAGGLQIIVLDEIDKLVKKSGDDTLYSLTRINSDLVKSRVCIIGISNDLTFKDFLDPRVLSSLSEEELVFPPYNADQLRDILCQRAKTAFLEGAVPDEVISLCAARAAQEHGDARRALDLLRVSGELAEREGASRVEERHVAAAQENIETDTMSECVRTLPVQSKIVLSSMLLLAGSGQKVFTSGQVIGIYRDLVRELDTEPLGHRRVSDLINDLTMLGIVASRVVSRGRYGRTTEIYFMNPTNDMRKVIMNEPRFAECALLEPLMR